MYAPSIDQMKQMEIEIGKEKGRQPGRPRILHRSSLSQPEDYSSNNFDYSDDFPQRPKKYRPKPFKPNSLIPQERAKPIPNVVDYLCDRRQAR
jgi:hypothetical protein